ncbi:chemotaxis response regulator protein-glutamate methylesterase [Pseudomonas sp.]|uniref:chemotaxis response regulator protein-glutamate methylesterase n=1 Tax=Pseudomonas sp. TaxID=306 RepID=UPI002BA9707D|nr:chemotaxis response regulator protein-glutamate methylesterase [Pseudomonas sp.]HUE94958.1 chemotaxis response regulator protein-glutamate methylesterase [Pseudomonas sp.]
MKIAIVNDMPMAVEALRRALAFAPEHQIVWVAGDGAEAVRRCAAQTPDLLLMDLVMPVMDGVEATRRIMAQSPCAILLVTGDSKQNLRQVFDAMGHGALDVVNTPTLGGEAGASLLRKIQNIGWLIGHADKQARYAAPSQTSGVAAQQLVAIGASAGGPAALAELLHGIPDGFPAAIVLVQHVDKVFAAGMADWLAQVSGVPVRLARDGEPPQRGTALLAGTDQHLRLLASGQLAYTAEPSGYSAYRPSIDLFFESVAAHWHGQAVGVLLTGMGRDGAAGLKQMRERGFLTIAQDQQSSAVYGMPKAAAELDAAVEIRPLQEIAPRLLSFLPER